LKPLLDICYVLFNDPLQIPSHFLSRPHMYKTLIALSLE